MAEDILHAVRKFVDIEGFPQPGRHLKRVRLSRPAAVTGNEKERHGTADKLIGDRRGILTPQIASAYSSGQNSMLPEESIADTVIRLRMEESQRAGAAMVPLTA